MKLTYSPVPISSDSKMPKTPKTVVFVDEESLPDYFYINETEKEKNGKIHNHCCQSVQHHANKFNLYPVEPHPRKKMAVACLHCFPGATPLKA